MNVKLSKFIQREHTFLWIYILLGIFVTIQAFLLGSKNFGTESNYTFYNNYIIFKQSFYHFIQNQDLYIHYPKEQFDLYKYSPTFALLFGIFAVLPDEIGLLLWNLLNILCLYWAIKQLDFLSLQQKNLTFLFLIPELLTSVQNQQSNALITALFIFTFVALEKKQLAFAAACVIFSGYIKIFGFAAVLLFAFYPQKLKSIFWLSFWMLIFALIPLIIINWEQYSFLFQSWRKMLAEDHAGSVGYSMMGWLETWFHLYLNKTFVVGLGLILLGISFLRINQYQNLTFRFLTCLSLLIWVVIFNHKAESPTFILALTAACLWFFYQDFTIPKAIFFASIILFSSLSSTDLFPAPIREDYIKPLVIKAVPCILLWFWICYQLIFQSFSKKQV